LTKKSGKPNRKFNL